MYLNCHTYYSLKYGMYSPEELVMDAVRNGVKALVLTDINNTSCTYSFIKNCEKYGIKPIVGIECRQDHEFRYLIIAKNKEGWREACAF